MVNIVGSIPTFSILPKIGRDNDSKYALEISKKTKNIINDSVLIQSQGGTIQDLEVYRSESNAEYKILNKFYDVLRLEAPYLVDSFFYYMEIDERDPYKRFYFPRRKVLNPVITAYQDVYDGKLDFLSVSQPKRTGKTTSGLKLAQMMGGRDPDGSIFGVGKGEGLVKRFYGGLLQDFETERTYQRFLSVFPEAKKIGEKDYKSAENLSIDLKSKNIFPTFTCRPIDGAIVGCTEANVLVYIDDCVKNHEEARNRDRLEFLCEKVTDDVLGRRLEGTPIIIQGTKYSLYDPITALQVKADELGWRWREVAVPALDPITDKSNWEIFRKDKKGIRKIFTTEYYQKERKLVTEETWAAEFQQEPFEAKGRMFAEKELNYFEELPVDREPDAIMAACDSADKGEDSGHEVILMVDDFIIPCPASLEYGLQDVSASESGRTEDTRMQKNRVGQKRTLSVQWSARGWKDTTFLMQKFNPQYIFVYYPDMLSGDYEVREYYTGDKKTPTKLWWVGKKLMESVSFDIIER